MITNNPVSFEGKTYPELLVSLTSAPLINGTDYTTAVNLVFTPARYNEAGQLEVLNKPEYVKTFRWSDIKNQATPTDLQKFGEINAIIQEFVNDNNV